MAFHGMGGGMASYLEEQKKRGRKTDSRTLRRVAQSFSPYKFQVVLVLIAILLTTVLGLVNPLLIQRIFDDAIGKRNLNLLIIYVLIMFTTPIVTGIIGVGQTYLNNIIGQQVMRDFRNKLYAHLQSMSLRFFTATRTGEIQSRLSNDVGGVEGVVHLNGAKHYYSHAISQSSPHAHLTWTASHLLVDHLQGRQCKTHYKQRNTKKPGFAYRYNAGNALREWYSLDQDLWSSEIRPGAV